jgi:hypothetical protein
MQVERTLNEKEEDVRKDSSFTLVFFTLSISVFSLVLSLLSWWFILRRLINCPRKSRLRGLGPEYADSNATSKN